MAKAKGSKAPVKHLHKGKKLEETKPLRVPASASHREYLRGNTP
jgi:hypothetical protein